MELRLTPLSLNHIWIGFAHIASDFPAIHFHGSNSFCGYVKTFNSFMSNPAAQEYICSFKRTLHILVLIGFVLILKSNNPKATSSCVLYFKSFANTSLIIVYKNKKMTRIERINSRIR